MAKPNFTLPNKPAIKSGSILSYNYTDDFTFVPAPLTFNRDSAATRVNEKGLIEDVGYFGPELVQNGDFSELGPELVTNGEFDTDSDWVKGVGTTISGGSANFVNATGVSLYQNIGTQSGFVKVTFSVTNYSNGTLNVYSGGNQSIGTINVSANALGNYVVYVNRSGGNVNIIFGSSDSFTGSIDNVSVKEVGQNWSFGTGWSIEDGVAVRVASSSTDLVQVGVFSNLTSIFKITFDVVRSAGSVRLRAGTFNLPYVNATDTYTYYATPTSNDQLKFQADSTFVGSIDNISVIEVLGDKPRIDYSDSLTEPSLLLEPQSTNLVTYSEDFSEWSTGESVVLANQLTSPSGKTTAYKLNALNSVNQQYVNLSPTVSSGSVYTLSCFVKKGEVDYICLVGLNPLTTSYFDLNNGTKLGNTAISSSIEDFGNGWYRCTSTFNADTTTKFSGIYLSYNGTSISNGTNISNGEGVYIWGAQLEELSYATSYIPTAGSTATRLGETANNAGDVNVFNSEEGVLYAEIAALANDGTNRCISLYDGSVDNRLTLVLGTTSNSIRALIKSNNSTSFDEQEIVASTLDFHKICVKYKENDFALWINGVEFATDTTGATPIGLDRITFDTGNGALNFYGKVKNIQVFNKALTDRELEILTIQ